MLMLNSKKKKPVYNDVDRILAQNSVQLELVSW